MKKKLLTGLTVMALAISTIGGTVFAAEPEATDLKSGVYAVDISWQPAMDAMMDPMIEINAENMTFDVYNKTAPETSKGSGTIAFADGKYTMTYENGNETTFTYANETITLTSKLYYGKASFDNFISYDAVNSSAGEGAELVSGEYLVDISWQPMMDAMMDPVVKVDADAMTFQVYNAGKADVIKGSGTIEVENGVYTLKYEGSENTTEFTYADGTITFESRLYYGAASFNQFGPYDATYYSALPVDDNTTGEGADTDNNSGTTDNNGTTDNSGAADNNTTTDANNTTGTTTTSPTTGDTTSSTWMIVICMAAVAAVGVAARKRAVA